MPCLDKHPNQVVFNEKTGSTEPVMVNRHSYSDRWEWDPDYEEENEPTETKESEEPKEPGDSKTFAVLCL